ASEEHMMDLMWPEQFLYHIDNNQLQVDFVPRALPMSFHYSKESSEIAIVPPNLTGIRDEGYVVPSNIVILEDNHIKVEFEKELYTPEGTQNVTITIHYKRWTTST